MSFTLLAQTSKCILKCGSQVGSRLSTQTELFRGGLPEFHFGVGSSRRQSPSIQNTSPVIKRSCDAEKMVGRAAHSSQSWTSPGNDCLSLVQLSSTLSSRLHIKFSSFSFTGRFSGSPHVELEKECSFNVIPEPGHIPPAMGHESCILSLFTSTKGKDSFHLIYLWKALYNSLLEHIPDMGRLLSLMRIGQHSTLFRLRNTTRTVTHQYLRITFTQSHPPPFLCIKHPI